MAAGKPKLTVNCAEIRATQQGICNAGMGRSRSIHFEVAEDLNNGLVSERRPGR